MKGLAHKFKVMEDEPIINFVILKQEYSDELCNVMVEEIASTFSESGIKISPVTYSEFNSATRIKMSDIIISRTYVDEYGKRKLMKNNASYIHDKDHWWWADSRYFWVDFHNFNNIMVFRIGMNFRIAFQWNLVFYNRLTRTLSEKYGEAYYLFFTKDTVEGYLAYRNGAIIAKNSLGDRRSRKITEFMQKFDYDINDILLVADNNLDTMLAPYDYKEYINLEKNISNEKDLPNRVKEDAILNADLSENEKEDIISSHILDDMDSMSAYLSEVKIWTKEKMKKNVDANIMYFKMDKEVNNVGKKK